MAIIPKPALSLTISLSLAPSSSSTIFRVYIYGPGLSTLLLVSLRALFLLIGFYKLLLIIFTAFFLSMRRTHLYLLPLITPTTNINLVECLTHLCLNIISWLSKLVAQMVRASPPGLCRANILGSSPFLPTFFYLNHLPHTVRLCSLIQSTHTGSSHRLIAYGDWWNG